MVSEGSTPVRVLVVDDSKVFGNVVRMIVAATPGFEVVGVASSGREALDLLSSTDPQLVLLDVRMPDEDGIETARLIHERHPHIVVVPLSATPNFVHDPSLVVEDKRAVSPEWLADFWRQQTETR